MIIKEFVAKNYRTLEDIRLVFDNYYIAISGKNNSGKSNILKAIRNILSTGVYFRMYPDEIIGLREFNFGKDYTNWKNIKDKEPEDIYLKLVLEIDCKADTSIYNFIKDLVLKDIEEGNDEKEKVDLQIEMTKKSNGETEYNIIFDGHLIEKDTPKRETLRRLKTAETIIFHNSTEIDTFPPFVAERESIKNFISEKDRKEISDKVDTVVKTVQKSLKKQQEELSTLLGRLEEKYEVSLSIEGLKLERETIGISLKEKGVDVDLDDWGSGTRNRTLIFLSLLNARRCQNNSSESDRISPIIIIEEPESFLHPSAQAEFGRILQDIASELKIQVIVSTHSPYLLSHKTPGANVLIDRDLKIKAKKKGSILISTDNDNWYEPFAKALGINGVDFGPLKNTIFNDSNEVVFVEGDIDKEYFELLRLEQHGKNKLNFAGEIYPYGGADVLKNNSLIKFIKNRYSKFIVTVDLDKYDEVKKSLESVGITENVNLITIGQNQSGKKNIEGLLPQTILGKVFTENADLVQAAMENSKDKKSAQSRLKQKYLEVFKSSAQTTEEYYSEFYKLTKKINKILEK
jgi:predicted ATP-dependent endonuclease of OLD family